MPVIVRKGPSLGAAAIAVLATAMLIWAWFDAGVEPVRPLTAPAILPEAVR